MAKLQRDIMMSGSGEEMRELISSRPHWMVRRGNTIFLLMFVLLAAGTWLIRYPDMVKGSMKLVAVNAPKMLTARTEGKLEKLLVSPDETVHKGQALAFLQSTARHQQVLALYQWISDIEPFIVRDSVGILLQNRLPLFDQLGEMQAAYQSFQSLFHETVQILPGGYYRQKRTSLLQDLYYLDSINKNIHDQQELTSRDLALQQKEYAANESLAAEKVIAPLELSREKSRVLSKEQGVKQMHAQGLNNRLTEENKKKELLELDKYIADQHQAFRAGLFGLKSRIGEWLQQYVVMAPESGKVLFVSFLQENQLLAPGQSLFYIQPEESRYYGQLLVSQAGLGKIRTGQRVLVRVESYPSNEFGYLKGVIGYISAIAGGRDSFLIRVDLPQGLRTSYGKDIVFRNNLQAEAGIVTDDRRLLERFAGQLREVFRR